MNKLLVTFCMFVLIVVSSGCATWDGIKEDSKNAYDSTKEAIHDATE